MIEYTPNWTNLFLWAVVVGFILAFVVAFGMGANDAANSYGTVVGAGVLKLWQAYVMATIFETLGAVLLGYKVIETMRKSIVNISVYNVHSQYDEANNTYYLVDNSSLCNASTNCTTYTSAGLIVGKVGALAGTGFWLLAATILNFPVSTTHSAVGATVGFSLVLKGAEGIRWMTIVHIVISWVVSPLLAGSISALLYLFIKFTCLKRDDPFEASLKMLPVIYFFTVTVDVFSVLYGGSKYLKFDLLSWWACLLISLAIGSIVALLMRFWGDDAIRRSVLKKMEANDNGPDMKSDAKQGETKDKGPDVKSDAKQMETKVKECDGKSDVKETEEIKEQGESTSLDGTTKNEAKSSTPKTKTLRTKLSALKEPVEEHPMAVKVFSYLQILSACFLSFSHGSNDTANAVAALVAVWLTYKHGSALAEDQTAEFITLFGAIGMVIGLWILGHKVIKTVGSDLVKVTSPSGFAMELGTGFTVLFASKIGIPVSTTHCMVGAVVLVGWIKSSKGGVSWTTVRNIGIAWIVTLPVVAAVSAFVTFMLNRFVVER